VVMEQARQRMPKAVAAAWAAHPPQARVEIAFVRIVATGFRTASGSPAIRRHVQTAGQQWPENNPNEEGELLCQVEMEQARWEWVQ